MGKVFFKLDGTQVALPEEGSLLIGREAQCDLAFDDPSVSRRHARVTISGSGIEIEDLQSANGVFVNGDPVTGRRRLAVGDRVAVGAQLLELTDRETHSGAPVERRIPYGAPGSDPQAARDTTKQKDALELLGSIAAKLLAAGKAVEAERVLGLHLHRIHSEAVALGELPDKTGDAAAHWAVQLAQATRKPFWVGYVFTLFTVARRPPPAAIVDELYGVIPKLPPIDLAPLKNYVAVLAQRQDLTASERSMAERISGLQAVAEGR
jgi:hypothetical protein